MARDLQIPVWPGAFFRVFCLPNHPNRLLVPIPTQTPTRISFHFSSLILHRNTLFYSPFCSIWSEKRLRAPSLLTFAPIRFTFITRTIGSTCFKWFLSNNSARFDSSPKWWSILIGRTWSTAPKRRSSIDSSAPCTKTRCRKPPIFGM